MKRINLFLIPLLIVSFVVAMTSCTNEGKSEVAKENNAISFQEFKFELPDDFFVTTYKLDEVNLSDLITSLNEELYEEPYEVPYDVELNKYMEEKNLTAGEISVYVGYNLNIDGNTNTVTLTPVMEDMLNYSDNQNCGGKDATGWISYGICMDEKCVDEKSNQAVQELASQLTPGKCVDIRVQRNRTNGRVCALLTDCPN